jgi:hypothetical protein
MVMKQGVNESCRIQHHYLYIAPTLAQLSFEIDFEAPMQFHRVGHEESYGPRCAWVANSARIQNNMSFEN